MKMSALVDEDERSVAIENESYRWGFAIMTLGLLFDLSVRDWLWPNPSYWDLLALLMVTNIFCIVYQAHHRILREHWVRPVGIGMIRVVLVAVLMVLAMRYLR